MTQVEQVRRFNRLVTARIGALDEAYLGRDRPLGASRVLWEIADDGADLRELRARLGLDSGYLSRLVARLVDEGLVTVAADGTDQRVRRARPTERGRQERRLLDDRSDDLAASLLAPLGTQQRQRLVTAMAEVERLLTAGLAELRSVDPSTAVVQACWAAYFAELAELFETGFDPDEARRVGLEEVREPRGVTLVALLRDEPVGCASLKHHGDWSEVKRVWVSPSARGLGVARRLMSELELRARESGATAVRLDTNQALTEAIRLYRSLGYEEIAPFNDEPYAHHWFEKRLT